jgi:hypothetical protein
MVFRASTYRAFALASSTEESEVRDPWVTRMPLSIDLCGFEADPSG